MGDVWTDMVVSPTRTRDRGVAQARWRLQSREHRQRRTGNVDRRCVAEVAKFAQPAQNPPEIVSPERPTGLVEADRFDDSNLVGLSKDRYSK